MCLHIKNGKIKWKRNLVSEYEVFQPTFDFAISPVIEGELVLLNANSRGAALNKESGELVWTSEGSYPSCADPNTFGAYPTPVIYQIESKRFVLLFNCAGLYSIDISTGEEQWFFEWYNWGLADPILLGDKVLISSAGETPESVLLGISGEKPGILWRNNSLISYYSTAVYADDYLYGCDGSGRYRVRCVNFNTGKVMWETRIFEHQWQYRKDYPIKVVDPKMTMTSITVADGKLIMLEEPGTLRIAEASPSTYEEISSATIVEGFSHQFWTPPVLYKGKIYCRDFGGSLICIDVSQ